MTLRIGHGYDVHALVPRRKFILGGIDIPYELGFQGHSDADVLIHAIIDALLGAAALGDIGKLFPDTDQNFKNISSEILLRKTNELLQNHAYQIVNIDSTIILQAPKIGKYILDMRNNISNILSIDLDKISIKATTEEFLGFTGEGKGAAVHAVALIIK